MSAPNAIQDRIKARILQHPFFSDAGAEAPRPVPVITADDGDILTAVERRTSVLTGGLALTILIPTGKNAQPASGAVCPELTIEISCVENPRINRAAGGMNKRAYEAARCLAKPGARPGADAGSGGLHYWEPGPPFTKLLFREFQELSVKTETEQTLLVYRATFTCSEMIS